MDINGAQFAADLCWLLGTSVLKIGILSTIEQASLPKNVRYEYNQRGPCCCYSLATCLSLRRGSISALCLHLNQAKGIFQLSRDPSTFFAVEKPRTTSLLLGIFADMTRGTSELLAENALLRRQLVILRRHIKRPVYKKRDRLLLVLLARMVRTRK